MLYKVADTFDEEVKVLTESLDELDGTPFDHRPRWNGGLHRHRHLHALDPIDYKTDGWKISEGRGKDEG